MTQPTAPVVNILCANKDTRYQNLSAILPNYSPCQESSSLPPPYEEICTDSVQESDTACVEDSENIYDVIPSVSDRPPSRPSVELSVLGQEFSAPDIFMEHKKKVREPFQAFVNGKVVDYITYVVTH